MSDPEHARMLLAMARKDLEALRGMENPVVFAEEVFGFHAQQAVEKTVKAWLSLLGVDYPKTHDLEMLTAMAEQEGDVLPEHLVDLVDLTDFAVQYRYEAFEDLGEEIDRQDLAVRIAELVRFVEQQVGERSPAS